MKTTKIKTCSPECEPEFAQAIRDTIDFFSGKWKLPILGALMGGKMRF
jgi:DNA-binding HxlR family transcriptional regulator